jgi:hypothetical protein
MNLRAGALVLSLALPVAFAPPARADDDVAAKTVIVDVAPGATEIDAAGLRDAIGKELEVTAVAPGDALAAGARGTITVSIDRQGHALVVSYREGGAPITRSIDLPADAPATARAAVLLAGNLARDEAGELVASLRKSQSSSQAASESAPASAGPVNEEAHKLDRLGATLESHVRDDHLRLGIWWTMVGTAVAASGTGLGLLLGGHSDAGLVLEEAGLGLAMTSGFVAPAHFDSLAEYYAHERSLGLPPERAREDVEQAWFRAAAKEHWIRKFFGWTDIVLGGIGAALWTVFVAANLESPSESTRSSALIGTGFLALDALGLGIGVSCVATDGPIESALHEYEASAGHGGRPSSASAIGPRVSVTRYGGFVGLGGRF